MVVKTAEEYVLLKKACVATKRLLVALGRSLREGMSTKDIESIAGEWMKKEQAVSAFLGYHGYPGLICVSVNEEIIHGIPSERKILNSGDIVSLDIGVAKEGFIGDCAATYPIGAVDAKRKRLISTTREALRVAIAIVRPGITTGDIGHAIQSCVESAGFSVVKDFAGHGLGRHLHEEPEVPNFGRNGEGVVLSEGMVLAIEPMVNMGGSDLRILPDGWTAVTADGLPSSHFEDTIVVTRDGCEVLTRTEYDE